MDRAGQEANQGKRGRLWLRPILCWSLGFVLVLLGLTWAYEFSFAHTPKRDQINYLLEISRAHGFSELVEKSYSFNRTNTVSAGDTQLFRPGLFLLLAVQSYFFDYHFQYFRWVSLVLHTGVSLLLFRFLRRLVLDLGTTELQRSWLAVGLPLTASLLFAFSITISEVVSWAHIQGYIVFAGMIVLCLDLFSRLEHSGATGYIRQRGVISIWILVLLASFFHESATIFALAFGVFLAMPGSVENKVDSRNSLRVLLAFALIPVIYATISFVDYWRHSDTFIREGYSEDLLLGISVQKTAYSWLRFLVFCCVQPLFPVLLRTEPLVCMIGVRDVLWTWKEPTVEQFLLRAVLLGLTSLYVVLIAWLVVSRARVRKYLPALTVSVLAGYISVYAVLRLNVRSELYTNFLGFNCQYVYLCLPLSVILVFQGFLMLCRRFDTVRFRIISLVLVLYLGISACLSAFQVHLLNRYAQVFSKDVRDNILDPGTHAMDEVLASGRRRVCFLFEDPILASRNSWFGAPLTTHFFGRYEATDQVEAFISLPSGKVSYVGDEEFRALLKAAMLFPTYKKTIPFQVSNFVFGKTRTEFRSSYAISRDLRGWIGVLAFYPVLPAGEADKLPFSVRSDSYDEVVELSRIAAGKATEAARKGRFLVGVPQMPYIHERYGDTLLVQFLTRYVAIPARPMGAAEAMILIKEAELHGKAADSLDELKARLEASEVPGPPEDDSGSETGQTQE